MNYEPCITKINERRCPLDKVSVMACWFCPYGHATECHYPLECDEAECSHYEREMVGSDVELGDPSENPDGAP